MLLEQLRLWGFAVSGGATGTLVVSPASRLTDEQRAQLRLHKHEIMRELAAEAADRHTTIISARDASGLDAWCAPLILGHLVVCGNCDAFKFGSDPAALGHCARFDIEAAPFCPFQCPGFQIAEEPAALPFVPDPGGVGARARKFE